MGKALQTITEHLDRLFHSDERLAKIYALFMAFLVLVICALFVIETYNIPPKLFETLIFIDLVITFIFLIDYILRWWANGFSIPYLFTPMALIDLFSILPLFLIGTHWQFVRILRVFRILRLLRMFQKKRFLLWKITEFHLRLTKIVFTLFCILFISAALFYDVEHKANPFELDNFFDAWYFTVVSLATVGYGDIVPVTTAGRVVTVLMIMSGILLIPWQLTTLAKYIVEDLNKTRFICSKCNANIHDIDAHFCKICGTKLHHKDHV